MEHENWESIDVQFGNALKKLRKERHMTQAEFADYCGISRAYYGRIELGKHSATLYMCQRIAEATGIYLYDFFKDITF